MDVLAPLLFHPDLVGVVEEELARIDLDDPACQRVLAAILALHAEQQHLDAELLADHLRAVGCGPSLDAISSMVVGAWYSDREMAKSRVVDGWREVVRRHQRSRPVRVRESWDLHGAMADERDEEAAAQTRRLDRLRNHDEEMDVSEPE